MNMSLPFPSLSHYILPDRVWVRFFSNSFGCWLWLHGNQDGVRKRAQVCVPQDAVGPDKEDLGHRHGRRVPGLERQDAEPAVRPLRQQLELPDLHRLHSLRGLDGLRGR